VKHLFLQLSLFALSIIFFSCSVEDDDTQKSGSNTSNVTIKQPNSEDSVIKTFNFPKVYIEEFDQSQEFFKEQHETSFSYVTKKNWFSYTAQKDGILTKILLFGKPNFKPSDHYGDSMHGFIREGNPSTGPKYGEWDLTRDDIINQIANQGLSERDAGWITIRMRGEIPQVAGKTYFFVCNKITGNKPWFGAFAFGEGNPYKSGRFWLHKEHDLVFRTYVGKTPEKTTIEEQDKTSVDETGLKIDSSSITSSPLPSLPLSQSPNSLNIESSSNDTKKLPAPNSNIETQGNIMEIEQNSSSSENLNLLIPNTSEKEDINSSKKKSLFNRLFNKK